jgi:uncharacterized membrane protein
MNGIKVHELHPALVHLPLTLLPMAATVDLVAAARDDFQLDRLGRVLWWAGATGGLFAGLAGAAASQEVRTASRESEDRMFVHGVGNLLVLKGAFGLAAWRGFRRASVAQALLGVALCGTAVYTAYLGGALVYHDRLGANEAATGRRLFARGSALQLARDAIRGLRWLLTRTVKTLERRQSIDRRAFVSDGAVAPTAAMLGRPLSELH